MRICWLVLALASLNPCAVAAQTVTVDGVQAFVRGDYRTAARILRPLAASTEQPDPIAQFFMAMLYESGRGVYPHQLHACALYVSAATPSNPFMAQSLILAHRIQETLDAFLEKFCSMDAWSDSVPVSFRLGQDHQVTIDDMVVTVAYQGTETNTTSLLEPGSVPLPVRYTPLDAAGPEARRHFLEFFRWKPDATSAPRTWSLTWELWEVTGPHFLGITYRENLRTVTSPQAPAGFDLRGITRVQVSANGEAEWIILDGPNRSRGIIPTVNPR
jgi:hypothetical protein